MLTHAVTVKAEIALPCYVTLLLHRSRLSHADCCCHPYLCLLLVLEPAEQCAPLQAGMCEFIGYGMLTINNLCFLHAKNLMPSAWSSEAVIRVSVLNYTGS